MIGLGFLAVGLLWLALSWYLATRLPAWFGVDKPVWRWILGTALFLVLLVGPFVDHIVGMRQFERLCAEQTGLQIFPNAANTKRGRELPAQVEPVEGYVVSINRQVRKILDLDAGEVIAQYNYFSTPGGRIGRLVRFGGQYTCAANQLRHFDEKKFTDLAKQVDLTYGEAK